MQKIGIYRCKGRKLQYLVRWSGEIDPETGKIKRNSRSFKTRAEAEGFKFELQQELKRTGGRDRPADDTLGKLCADFLRVKKADVRPGSLDLYTWTTERLLKFFGPGRKVNTIRAKDADLFMAAQEYRQDGKVKLSDWTRLQIVVNCRALFKVAVRWNLTAENPFAETKKPKATVSRWHYLKPDEYLRLLDAAPDLRWKAFYALAYTSGARFGELFSLTWADIDFDAGTVKIENRAGGPTMPPFHVKDGEGRTVPLPKDTLDILAQYQAQAPEGVPYVLLTAERYGRVLDRWRKLDMVDHLWQNRFIVNNTLRDFRGHARRAEITFDGKFTIHTFRKSYGQTMANNGVSIKTLQYLMGHSEEKTTLAYYTQLDKGQVKLARDATDRLLADARAKRTDAQLTREPSKGESISDNGGIPENVSSDSTGVCEGGF
jgi:integrase